MKNIFIFIMLVLMVVGCDTQPTKNLKQFPIVEKTQRPQVSKPDTCYHQWVHTEMAIFVSEHYVRPCGVNICIKCGMMIFDPNYLNIIEITNQKSFPNKKIKL